MKYRRMMIWLCSILGLILLFYLCGLIGQFLQNYNDYLEAGGLLGQATMQRLSLNPIVCFSYSFTKRGLIAILLFLVVGTATATYFRFYDLFHGIVGDERGFQKSNTGAYGTAEWMGRKELQSVLETTSIEKAEGTILGELNGNAVCMPKDTRLNRHIAIFGASGTMKSRAIIRNALFQAIRRGESIILTDPKGDLYGDTAELYRKYGYEVRVFNLVHPEHGDSWNCMSDLQGDTLMAQMLTSVIIGNTSSGKGDHFWDNGESNLLKALMLYIDQDPARDPSEKNLPAVYELLTTKNEKQLTTLFAKLPQGHPAKAPFSLFEQASDTVKAGIILGLGTRLQVLQNEMVKQITSRSDIDITAPAKRKCAYYIILSDSEGSLAFLSSLLFSSFLIKLPRFADSQPDGKCPVPVNLILDEFNNIGRIGGAADGSDFARSLSTVRSRDIKIMIAVQSLGQLQNRYPSNLWAEIIGNVDIQLMLGCSDDLTAEYFSGRSGEMSIMVRSTSTQRRTIALAQIIPEYRQTEGQGKRKLLTPDEVLRLPAEEMLCVVRGHNMLKLRKLDYTKHPMSKEIRKVSIMDYEPSYHSVPKPSWDPTPPPAPPQPEPTPPPPRRSPRPAPLGEDDPINF